MAKADRFLASDNTLILVVYVLMWYQCSSIAANVSHVYMGDIYIHTSSSNEWSNANAQYTWNRIALTH